MEFQKNTVFHIYNQGNNRQAIFFGPENYLFFIKKMREHVMPYGDFLCYCLMPNHFHWLFYVREIELPVISGHSLDVTRSHADINVTPKSHDEKNTDSVNLRTLNDSIGILLRSYTRAINKQENRSGSLFREKTKAEDGWEDHFMSITHPNHNYALQRWEDYGLTAFNYIHQNPVKAHLVDRAEEWPYSSAPDFAGIRNGTLCNQKLAKALLFLK